MSTLFHNILRAAASAMEIPVVICLPAVGVFRVFTGLVAGGAAGRAAAYERQSAPAAGDHAKRLRQQEGLSGGGDLEKRGEVYYDAKTGTYYIVPNAAGN